MDSCSIIIGCIFESVKFINDILNLNDDSFTPIIKKNIKKLNELGVNLIFTNNNYYVTNIDLPKKPK